jgi:gag-polypeptide of LTR copia-type/Zinc knuckle
MAAKSDTSALRGIRLELLVGKDDWPRWKFKALPVLKVVKGTIDVIEKRLTEPVDPGARATADEKKAYDEADLKYCKAFNHSMAILTNALSDDVLDKIMRFDNPWDIWTELHRLFDGIAEDKVYTLTNEFFEYKPTSGEDVASIMSKLKTMWNKLNVEIVIVEKKYKDIGGLPEVMLICKILGSLGDDYFGFKSSWMMLKKEERTFETLQPQLIAYERELTKKNGIAIGGMEPEMALFAARGPRGNGGNGSSGERCERGSPGGACFYCKKSGHWIKDCRRWAEDGKPSVDRNGDRRDGRTRTGDSVGGTRETEVSHQVSVEMPGSDWSIMDQAYTLNKNSFDWSEM